MTRAGTLGSVSGGNTIGTTGGLTSAMKCQMKSPQHGYQKYRARGKKSKIEEEE